MTSLAVRDPALHRVVGRDAALRQVAAGHAFTEGALWHPQRRELLFTDMPNNRIHRWREGAGTSLLREPSHKANGLTWDRQGRLLACEHATSRVTRTEADGRVTVLASHFQGRELNSPNDIVVRGDGRIFFTDPIYGRRPFYGVPREPELDFRGVYTMRGEGDPPVLLVDDFAQPNGLCLSADERRLFVNDTERGHIRVFDLDADGALTDGRVWAQPVGEGEGAPDGMKLDAAGNLYCTGPGGIHVFAPDARCLGVIATPEYTANFCFGGDDLRTLFVCASTSIYALQVESAGRPLI